MSNSIGEFISNLYDLRSLLHAAACLSDENKTPTDVRRNNAVREHTIRVVYLALEPILTKLQNKNARIIDAEDGRPRSKAA
jgi:hypothetical protein